MTEGIWGDGRRGAGSVQAATGETEAQVRSAAALALRSPLQTSGLAETPETLLVTFSPGRGGN